MTGNGGSGEPAGAGGPVPHIPVLAGAVLRALSPRDGGVYIDGTFGAGGHTQQILAAADCRVIAIDRDPTAVARAIPLVERFGGRLTIVEDTFSALGDIADI
ncbi:MAG: 16S rRNA (cytosine(1402)-N(4))-methyltransferase, partial [Rhizobiales bacterium]|nr:16S rRNA (cytosine(1402)-N(4))-methyltransferase [Hyphomicrobiales bacterium]